MLEAEFWQKRVKPGLTAARWWSRRIEDSSGNLGTWDTYCARDRISVWIELKVAGPNAKPSLRKGQPAFGEQLYANGIPGAYLIGSPNGLVRLCGPRMRGHDWQEHLLWRGFFPNTIIDMSRLMGRILEQRYLR